LDIAYRDKKVVGVFVRFREKLQVNGANNGEDVVYLVTNESL
jgi:hypothetical protein